MNVFERKRYSRFIAYAVSLRSALASISKPGRSRVFTYCHDGATVSRFRGTNHLAEYALFADRSLANFWNQTMSSRMLLDSQLGPSLSHRSVAGLMVTVK